MDLLITTIAIFFAIKWIQTRRELKYYKGMAQRSTGFIQELMQRVEMTEIKKFLDYLKEVGLWYEDKKEDRRLESEDRRLATEIEETNQPGRWRRFVELFKDWIIR